MKRIFMMLGFLTLFFASLSATNIFDGKIIFTSHDSTKDSLGYICIEKAGGVIDTVMEIDTLGNVRMLGTFLQDNIWLRAGDTLWFVDATLADTSWITNTGTYLEFGGDIQFKFLMGVTFSSQVVYNSSITMTSNISYIQTNGRRLFLDDNNDDQLAMIIFHHEDSIIVDTSTHIFEWTGDGGYKSSCFDGDSLNIGDEEWLKKLDFGSNVFGDAKTADTVLISGATASDLYLITAKDSIPAGYWTTISKVDTLIVNSSAAENDTPFIWWRFK